MGCCEEGFESFLLHAQVNLVEPVGAVGGEAVRNAQLSEKCGRAFEDRFRRLAAVGQDQERGESSGNQRVAGGGEQESALVEMSGKVEGALTALYDPVRGLEGFRIGGELPAQIDQGAVLSFCIERRKDFLDAAEIFVERFCHTRIFYRGPALKISGNSLT